MQRKTKTPLKSRKIAPAIRANRSFKSMSNTSKRSISNQRKKLNKQNKNYDSDNSSSSSDEFLVNPADIDLASCFFNLLPIETTVPAPKNTAQHLAKTKTNSTALSDCEEEAGPSTKNVDFRDYQNFANNLKRAKDHLKNYKLNTFPEATITDAVDVKQLLALGEIAGNDKMETDVINDSDTDWEEVEGMNATIYDIMFII